jgi:hypothetical protein
LFKIFGLFGECVCIHCFGCSFVSTFINEPRFHHLLQVIEKFVAMFVVLLQNISAEAILCILCAPVNIFGTQLTQNM